MDVLLSHTVPPFGFRDRASTREQGKLHVGVVPQEEPYSRPGSDKDVYTAPTLLLPRLSPIVAKRRRNSSTNRSGGQSPCSPRTGSQRPQYAGSRKESGDASPSRRTAVASKEINVMAHQILARRTPHMPRCIPPPE
jgi:hypothetical protein